ncbi:MAG: diaminopimelate epimerase [Pseudomonadota bacterium]|jgi:diaminopimelate epimerase
MNLHFTKMHGAGNDFVVLNALNGLPDLSPEQYRQIADRRYGVGCDQLLIIAPPVDTANDFSYRIINSDGSEVEQCGNGARCFMRFVCDEGLTTQKSVRVEVATGVIILQECDNGLIEVNMGIPRFNPSDLHFNPQGLDYVVNNNTGFLTYYFDFPADTAHKETINLSVGTVSMGNPHAVHTVENIDTAKVLEYGTWLENHNAFSRRVNVGFMQIIDTHTIKLRVWERGAGETLACGTGACAAAVVGIQQGVLNSPVTVQAKGGTLTIDWKGKADDSVLMRGPAVTVFKGILNLTPIK